MDTSKGFYGMREDRYLERNDPLAFQPFTGQSITTPRGFDCTDNARLFNEPVPLEFQRWTTVPDALLNAINSFNLTGVETRIMLAIHKHTLGFLEPTKQTKYNSDRALKFKAMPFNMISSSFGNHNRKSTGEDSHGKTYFKKSANNVRARFIRTTVRALTEAVNGKRSTVHRAFKHLQHLKLIQLKSHPVEGTILGINYHTLEAVFGGSRVAFHASKPKKNNTKYVGNGEDKSAYLRPESDLPQMVEEGLIEMKGQYVTRLKSSVENIIKMQYDNGILKSFVHGHKQFKTLMARAFDDNVFVRRAIFPELYSQPSLS